MHSCWIPFGMFIFEFEIRKFKWKIEKNNKKTENLGQLFPLPAHPVFLIPPIWATARPTSASSLP
jgi:hypothetical protein